MTYNGKKRLGEIAPNHPFAKPQVLLGSAPVRFIPPKSPPPGPAPRALKQCRSMRDPDQ
jgi:hypothetical protein